MPDDGALTHARGPRQETGFPARSKLVDRVVNKRIELGAVLGQESSFDSHLHDGLDVRNLEKDAPAIGQEDAALDLDPLAARLAIELVLIGAIFFSPPVVPTAHAEVADVGDRLRVERVGELHNDSIFKRVNLFGQIELPPRVSDAVETARLRLVGIPSE